MSYTELDTSTNFSFLSGGSHPEEYIEAAAQLGYSAIGIADKNTLSGVVRAHFAGKELGIKALIGARVSLLEELPQKPLDEESLLNTTASTYDYLELPLEILFYPGSKGAYEWLSNLLSLGKLRATKGCCWLRIEDLENIPTDLAAIISLTNLKDKRLESKLALLKEILPKTKLAIHRDYFAKEKDRTETTLGLAKQFGLPLIATNRVLYHEPKRKALADILTCIRLGKTIQQAGFYLKQNAERYLKPAKEMKRLFRYLPETIKNAALIAEQAAGFSLEELKYEYPEEICPSGQSPQKYLETLTWHGAAERYPLGVPTNVREQLEHEFQLIAELDYAKYFLTVYKIVAFARSKKILCQGRGAAANSAVCYCLGVTAVDPSKTRLLVERFISKERGEPPDIDVDFEHERREEVIQYIYQTFGRRRAALVCEVVTYRMKSSIREVGKVLGLTDDTIKTLQRLYYRRVEDEPLTKEEIRSRGLNPEEQTIKQTLKLARTIRGFPRHLSQHVGGFVISDVPISNIVPIENAAMPERTVIEWDKDDIELMGMLKIDVLGLGMLTCIRKALELLNDHNLSEEINFEEQTQAHKEVMLHNIPAEDPAVYDMLCAADSIGVFQVESRAQMNMLPRLRPRCFFDLVIEVAIVRPGPIQGGMVHPFLKRRQGKEPITYPSEEVKAILGDTLGVPIFQEQIMELAVVAAGFTPGEADQLRRAIASWKRNKKAMAHYARKLVNGLLAKGYTAEFAKQVFNQIKGFSEYGFPQSHAASFSLLVYASAWLKHYHPQVFAAALINSHPMGFYRPSQIIQDAEHHGVKVRAADVNHSDWNCTLEGEDSKELRLGLRLVKGLQEEEARKLVAAVKVKGNFKNAKEIWKETDIKVSSLRALARADCFRSMGLDRQKALWQLKALKDEVLPLFEFVKEKEAAVSLPKVSKQEDVFFDYEYYGHSLKAHPLSFFRKTLNKQGVSTISQFKDSKHGSKLAISGLSVIRQKPPTAKGVLFMTVEDETGLANIIFKPEVYKEHRLTIIESDCLVFYGQVQKVNGVINLLANDCSDITDTVGRVNLRSRDFH